MTHERSRVGLTVPLLLVLGFALMACGGDSDDDESGSSPLADLPAESRLVVGANGPIPFNGTVEQYLAILPFEPLFPDSIPGDRALQTATIVPSREATGKVDLEASLILVYRGDDDTSVQITEQRQPMADLSAIAEETVAVGGVDALLISFEGSEALQLMWHDCDLTLVISSSVIDRDEMVTMGESITDACPDAVG